MFIQNLAPGAAARAGFDSGGLRARNPRLIAVDISGYGSEGAYADMKAYDLLVQAESGLCSVTGGPEGPGRVGVSVCDIACGMYSYMAVLEAVIARADSGEGCAIETSLFSGMADWMTVPLLHWESDGQGPPRIGAQPSLDPPLRRLPDQGRRADPDRDPERARVSSASAPRCCGAPGCPTTPASRATSPGSTTASPSTRSSARCSPR